MLKKILILCGVLLVACIVGINAYNHGTTVSGDDTFYMVSHSEYWSGETGQVIARLYDWQGSPITVTNCTVDIYNPNKSPLVAGALTTDTLQTTTGTHYYTFTVPSTEGVYQYMVTCNYPNNKVRSVASTFHVSPALNLEKVINTTTILAREEQTLYYNNVQVNLSDIKGTLVTVTSDLGTIKLNLTTIAQDTNYIRTNMLTDTIFQTNITTVINNQGTIIAKSDQILSNLTAIENFCSDAVTSGSQLCLWVNEIKNKVTDINNTISQYTTILAEINSTTHTTYDYVTGALASNINTIIGTTNRIEANTVQINTTVNRIDNTVIGINTSVATVITNQQNEVYMEVTS